jgi:type IV secretory pathway TrbD component
MAPRRPVLFPGQYALALVTGLLLIASVGLVIWAVFG